MQGVTLRITSLKKLLGPSVCIAQKPWWITWISLIATLKSRKLFFTPALRIFHFMIVNGCRRISFNSTELESIRGRMRNKDAKNNYLNLCRSLALGNACWQRIAKTWKGKNNCNTMELRLAFCKRHIKSSWHKSFNPKNRDLLLINCRRCLTLQLLQCTTGLERRKGLSALNFDQYTNVSERHLTNAPPLLQDLCLGHTKRSKD